MSTNLTAGPYDDTAVTAALRAVMALDGMQQAVFAARLAAIDPRFADGMGVLIMDAVGLTMPPPLGMVIGGPALSLDAPLSPSEQFAQNVLRRVADEDCRYQLAWTQ